MFVAPKTVPEAPPAPEPEAPKRSPLAPAPTPVERHRGPALGGHVRVLGHVELGTLRGAGGGVGIAGSLDVARHGGWMLSDAGGGTAEIIAAPGAPERGAAASTSFNQDEARQPEAYVVLDSPASLFVTRLQFRMDLSTCGGEVSCASMSFADANVVVSLERLESGEVNLVILDALGATSRYPLDPMVLVSAGPWAKCEIRTSLTDGYVDLLLDDDTIRQVLELPVPAEFANPAQIRLGVARKSTGFECAIGFDDVLLY